MNTGNKKHTQHAPSTTTECDHLNGWIKNGLLRKNLTQNCEPQRYYWGTQKKTKNHDFHNSDAEDDEDDDEGDDDEDEDN